MLEQASARDDRRVESLAVRSFATRWEMGQAAANDIAAEMRLRLARQSAVRVIFAAAPSQNEMLESLLGVQGVEWPRVTAFHMDEYVGLPADAPQRFGPWLKKRLFDRLPFGAVHLMQSDPDPEKGAREYANLLAAAPIDIVCLGIGSNGHIAFNDPPVADFKDPLDVKVIRLDDEVCRQQQVNDGAFASVEEMPWTALTVTVPRLLRADRLFAVVPGAQKRDAVRRTLTEAVSTACPATILRQHPGAVLYLDAASDPTLEQHR